MAGAMSAHMSLHRGPRHEGALVNHVKAYLKPADQVGEVAVTKGGVWQQHDVWGPCGQCSLHARH